MDAGVPGLAMPLLGVTRGTHIVVQRFPGAPADALYVEARSDGRPFFIIPWNGLYLIGTTDERYSGDPDAVMPTAEELAYLIEETNSVIPSAGLTRESVCYAYSGLRPLPHQRAGSESGITRRHIIHDHAPQVRGLLSIVGGKLTTFRNLSEQAVDAIGGLLGRSLPPSTTASSALPGAVDNFTTFATDFVEGRPGWLGEETATRLLRTYGARATRVIDLANGDPSLKSELGAVGHGIGAEVVLALEDEFAVTLSDIMMRRTMLGYAADAGSGSTSAVATIAASVSGWDDARLEEELRAHQRWMQRFIPAW